jgi:hypothetical protein
MGRTLIAQSSWSAEAEGRGQREGSIVAWMGQGLEGIGGPGLREPGGLVGGRGSGHCPYAPAKGGTVGGERGMPAKTGHRNLGGGLRVAVSG